MSQANQKHRDPFSLFLKNVRKKDARPEMFGETAATLDSAIIDSLAREERCTVKQLLEEYQVSVTELFEQLGKLRKADLITVERDTDVVELTDLGRQLVEVQQAGRAVD